MKTVHVVAAVIRDGNRVFATQRQSYVKKTVSLRHSADTANTRTAGNSRAEKWKPGKARRKR